MTRSDEYWEIAIAVNAAFKGILGSMGESGHICGSVESPSAQLDLESGWPHVRTELVELAAPLLEDGDVLVVADKVVAASLGRTADRRVLTDPDPKMITEQRRAELAVELEQRTGLLVGSTHLLIADEYGDDQACLGTDEPNRRCAEIAEFVETTTGRSVDVVISDTDTGLDVRQPLIGTLTIAATPIGATSGLNLYEAMRCAVASEFARGHERKRPITICKPAERRRERTDIGAARRYDGFLHIDDEEGLTYE
ncbi:coenzyme F420-0:L-glutamate ligase [Haloactinomyces albus]|uniref:Uncharacterized protein n=1 Tax=Haloactinomyces albus TaxID=1352928 RepID=A0AAE4CRA4_9ACTN|nr:hypothetical protein [Haloactinomyces albus]MDR7303523.1 hypothetical protein [Haloactinomyces albus]